MEPEPAGLSDGKLLAEFAATGRETPFEELVRRHGAMVMGVCLRVLGERQAAEDAVQDTFVTLAHKAASLAARTSAAGWLCRAARHVALRAREGAAVRRAREQEAGKMMRQASAPEPHEPHREEFRAVLDAELDALPERYRAPMVLHHMNGRSEEDCAAALGCKVGTVSARLSRGRDLLRQRLSRRGLLLPAGLLAAFLSEEAAAAELSPEVAAAAVRSAALAAAGRLSAAGLAGRPVLVGRALLAAALLAGAFLLGVGAGLAARRPSAGQAPPFAEEYPGSTAWEHAALPGPDRDGDQLPLPEAPAGPEAPAPAEEARAEPEAEAEAGPAELLRLAREELERARKLCVVLKCSKTRRRAARCRRAASEYALRLAELGEVDAARELLREVWRLEDGGAATAPPAGPAEIF